MWTLICGDWEPILDDIGFISSKLYKLKEIIINYRHDDKEQIEDAAKASVHTNEYHIGTYSTDIHFKP